MKTIIMLFCLFVTPAYAQPNPIEFGADPSGVNDSTAAFTNALATSKAITVEPGTYRINGTIEVPHGGQIIGAGSGAVTITRTSPGHLFYTPNDRFSIRGLTIQGPASTSPGSAAIFTTVNAPGTTKAHSIELSDLRISGFDHGIVVDGCAETCNISHVFIHNTSSHGIVGRDAQGYWNAVNVVAAKGHGVYLTVASPRGGTPPWITGLQTFGNGGYDVVAEAGIYMVQSFLNNSSLGGLRINNIVPTADAGYVADTNIQWAGWNMFAPAPGYPNNPTAPGVWVTGDGPVVFKNLHIFGSNGPGMVVENSGVKVTSGNVLGAGLGGVLGQHYGVLLKGGSHSVTDMTLWNPLRVEGNHHRIINNTIHTVGPTPSVHVVSGEKHILSLNSIANPGGAAVQSDSGATMIYRDNVVFSGAELIAPGTRLP